MRYETSVNSERGVESSIAFLQTAAAAADIADYLEPAKCDDEAAMLFYQNCVTYSRCPHFTRLQNSLRELESIDSMGRDILNSVGK